MTLAGRVAVVAGATRGAGRGIAVALGEAGATVYCTGRSVRGRPATGTRPETIEETAELVTAAGGRGVFVRADHTVEEDVVAVFDRVRKDEGRLDVLVDDVWGGEDLVSWGTRFWQADVPVRTLLDRAVGSHVLTVRHGVAAMIALAGDRPPRGLVVEVTDNHLPGYAGNFAYDLVKSAIRRIAYTMACDLADAGHTGITALAITPGFLRSEEMLDRFGVTEATWRDGIAKDRHFAESETPLYVGRAIAALAADPEVGRKAGRTFASGPLAREYGFVDADGRTPNFPEYFQRTVREIVARGVRDDHERWLIGAWARQAELEPSLADEVEAVRRALRG